MKNNNRFNNITRIRKEFGITLEELGSKIGVTRQAISLSETGHVSAKTAAKIAMGLNVSAVELIGLDNIKILPKNESERQYLIGLLNGLVFSDQPQNEFKEEYL